MYNSINFNYGVRGDVARSAWNAPPMDEAVWAGDWGRSNATANITYVNAFLCPSDGNNGGNNTLLHQRRTPAHLHHGLLLERGHWAGSSAGAR